MDVESVQPVLDGWTRTGLLTKNGSSPAEFALGPDSRARAALEETAQAYGKNRVAVIDFIFSKPAQSFSDAFLFRPKEE